MNRVKAERTLAAGKAANVAAELLRLGTSCELAGFVGEDNARDYLAMLATRLSYGRAQACVMEPDHLACDENDRYKRGRILASSPDGGCAIELLLTSGRVRENLTLLSGGETIKINRSGMRVERCQFDTLNQMIANRTAAGAVVVFSGSMPDGMTTEDYCALMRTASAAGGRVAVDTDALSYEQLLSVRPWLYKPNEHELTTLCGLSNEEEPALLDAAARLAACGVGVVLLTLGAEGLAVASSGSVVRLPAVKTEPVCTVGAGDCALAGFIAAFIAQGSLAECAQAAAVSGARAVAMQS